MDDLGTLPDREAVLSNSRLQRRNDYIDKNIYNQEWIIVKGECGQNRR